MDIVDRIKQLIEKEGLNISAFARVIGVNDQTIRGIVVQRRNKPGYEVIVKIIQAFDWLDSEWLLTGNGEMKKATDSGSDQSQNCIQLKEYINYMREKDETIKQLIEEKTRYRIEYEKLLAQMNSKK